MGSQAKHSTTGYGLLANGASGRWEVALDESLDRDNDWILEIEGPNVYLALCVDDLDLIPMALSVLQPALYNNERPKRAALTLGALGPAMVSLLRDDEQPLRCFLVVEPQAGSTLRLTLDAEDMRMLADALHQVSEVLPAEPQESHQPVKTEQ